MSDPTPPDDPAAGPAAIPCAGPRAFRLGLALSVLVGLGATAYGVFSPHVLAIYSTVGDSVDITHWAEKATFATVPKWFTGPWIQETSPYYRPLSSVAFWLEYLAFGWNFQGHVVISWLLHAWVCACLYWFAWGLMGGPPGRRAVFPALAVVIFNIRRGPTGPGWMPAPVAYGVVAWWPGQTDQWCLAASLPALILFDRWLTAPAPTDGTRPSRPLWPALVLWALALLFKEMAVVLPLVAAVLVVHRRGWGAAIPWREGRPGLAWMVLIPGLVLVAGFLAMRSAFVPGAWGPQARSLSYFVEKLIWYTAQAPLFAMQSRGAWAGIVGAFLAACVVVYVRLPRRPSGVWLALAMVVGAGALCQALAGNFALITIPDEVMALLLIALFVLGVVALLHVREALPWTMLCMTAAVHPPILHVQGPHYMYWPAALWGLFGASLLKWVWEVGLRRTPR